MPASGLKHTATDSPWRWIPSLYLIEGLPNAIVVTVAVVMLKNMGIDNGHTALYTSLLYLPWVIKPFWSPFVDIFGSKRRWTIAMQVLMGCGMGAIALTLSTPWWLMAALVALWAIAFSSATHDIAADGFYMLALDERQQALFVGIRSTFYRLATLLASGGVVWAAGRMMATGHSVAASWSLMFAALAAIFLIASAWHSASLPHPTTDHNRGAKSAKEIAADFGRTFATFFARPGIVTAVAFMLLYRFPEALLGKMVQPFLLDPVHAGGLGLSTQQVGLVNGTFGVIGIVAGGIIGGITIARFGLRRCIWPMALALTLPSGFYCYLAAVQPESIALISTGIALEQFGYGFGFTAYMMYMMQFCEGSPYTTSHYAFCTGIMALGLMLPGLFSGWFQQALGYSDFFIAVMVMCVLTFAVTAAVHRSLRAKA